MNAHALLGQLWLATWVGSLAIVAALALRGIARRRFGAGVAYAVWWLVPAAGLALLLPARQAETPLALPFPSPVPETSTAATVAAANDLSLIWLGLWLVGALAMGGMLWWQQRRFVRSLGRLRVLAAGDGIGVGARVLQAESCAGLPALVGVMRPRVVVPADFEVRYDVEQRALMLAHEDAHLRRGDAWVNALAAALRAVAWCNPLVHVAASRLRHDQELACDASVVAQRPHSRRVYADAMLKTLVAAQPLPLGCHWGVTHPLKERIMMLKQERPSPRVRLAGATLVGMVAVAAAFVAWSAQPAQSRPASTGSAADYGVAIDVSEDGGKPVRFAADRRFGERFTVAGGDAPGQVGLSASVEPVDFHGELAYDIAMRVERDGKLVDTPRMVVRDGKRASLRQGSESDGHFRGVEIGMAVTARDPAAALKRARPFESPSMQPAAALPAAPTYPQAALAQGIDGKVVLILDIGADGSVDNAVVEQSEPAGVFDAAALEAVKRWKFTPKVQDGKPVASRVRIPVEWRSDEKHQGEDG